MVIFQDFSLFPNLSVAENIAFAAVHRAAPQDDRPAGCAALAAGSSRASACGSTSRRRSRALGRAQAADAICRALAADARLIFMDEPTTALTRARSRGAVRHRRRSSRRTASRSSSSATSSRRSSQLSERITVLRNGAVVVTGGVSDFDRSALTVTMTGRALTDTPPPDTLRDDAGPLLEVRGSDLRGRASRTSASPCGRARSSASPVCSAPGAPRSRSRCSASSRPTRARSRSRAAASGSIRSRTRSPPAWATSPATA